MDFFSVKNCVVTHKSRRAGYCNGKRIVLKFNDSVVGFLGSRKRARRRGMLFLPFRQRDPFRFVARCDVSRHGGRGVSVVRNVYVFACTTVLWTGRKKKVILYLDVRWNRQLGHRYTFSGNRENGGKKTDSQLLRSTPTYDRVERRMPNERGQTRFTSVVPRVDDDIRSHARRVSGGRDSGKNWKQRRLFFVVFPSDGGHTLRHSYVYTYIYKYITILFGVNQKK